jgi:CBS domain-containing protein/sporulation protein YlmC with PRC-barrel domain
MLGKPVIDAAGKTIGAVSDLAISTGEIFPRVTAVAFRGPDKTPFLLSWHEYVEKVSGDAIRLRVPAAQLRFSYLPPTELLLSRDLLNKQSVDTQGKKIVHVSDLKLSDSANALRLLGAEVGLLGRLRRLSPQLERAAVALTRFFGRPLRESIIAWNYMDLLERDLSQLKLSISHKRLDEIHPADVADILETLKPEQRAMVFRHLDKEAAADTLSEMEDEMQADVIEDIEEDRASDLLAEMDPDDAADIIKDLEPDKAERLLRLMGVEDSNMIRSLLGYHDETAGGLMTPEFTSAPEGATVKEAIDALRAEDEDRESMYYLYLVDGVGKLTGSVSLRALLKHKGKTPLAEFATRDMITVTPDIDQETVADMISKYNLLAIPVLDDEGVLLGVVTVDDAMEVMAERER